MSVSVLIINWKSKDYLRECLKSIENTAKELVTQIVVVDGGSFDGCSEMIASEFPSVQLVQSQENLGFGKSNNLGFEHVTEEYLFLLNPDTELKPNALQQMLATISKSSNVGIVGARLLNTDGSLQTSCVQAFPTPQNQAFDSEFLRRLFPKSSWWGTYNAFSSRGTVEVEAVSGAAMLMQSETFRKTGGFDKQFFMYGEDMDLSAKTRYASLKVIYNPSAEIIHHGGGSSSTEFSEFSTVFMRESIHYFIRKHQGPRAAVLYRFLMGASAVLRVSTLSVRQIFVSSRKKSESQSSVRKWIAILRWALGFENWVKSYA